MKKLILLLIFIPLVSFSQKLTDEEISKEYELLTSEYRAGNFSEAVNMADKLLKKTDDEFWSSHTYFYKGLSYLALEKTDKSISSLTKAIEISPRVHFYNSRATAYMVSQQWTKTIEDTLKGLDIVNDTDDIEIKRSLLMQSAVSKYMLDKDYCDDLVSANSIRKIDDNEFYVSLESCN